MRNNHLPQWFMPVIIATLVSVGGAAIHFGYNEKAVSTIERDIVDQRTDFERQITTDRAELDRQIFDIKEDMRQIALSHTELEKDVLVQLARIQVTQTTILDRIEDIVGRE